MFAMARLVLGSVFLATLMSSGFVSAAEAGAPVGPRVYASAQGDMDLHALARIVEDRAAICSHDGKPLPVVIQHVRWPYNPVDYARYLVSWGIATYVVSMTIGEHRVLCSMQVNTRSHRAHFEGCRGAIEMPPMGAFRLDEFMPRFQHGPEGDPASYPSYRDPFDEMY